LPQFSTGNEKCLLGCSAMDVPRHLHAKANYRTENLDCGT
jgi:hypothetical protein